MPSVPCDQCGQEAFAKVDATDGFGWYGSTRHDASRFVMVDRSAPRGHACDDCLDRMLANGTVARYADPDGYLPPSAIGRHGAVALFLRGFREALRTSEEPWAPTETDFLAVHMPDGTTLHAKATVPLPGWMAASGRLWQAMSSVGFGSGRNETDFESLGALFYLVSKALPDDVKPGRVETMSHDIRAAAEETFDRELAVHARLEEARSWTDVESAPGPA